jgi:hypothetical protein
MKIPRLKILYILLLVALCVILVFAVFRPISTGSKYTEVQRESLLKSESGWVVQFKLVNYEGAEQDYTVHFAIDDDSPYLEEVRLQDRKSFTFIRRIPLHELEGKPSRATFAIYKAVRLWQKA